MKRVFRHEDRFLVWRLKQLLDARGIPCFIKNEYAIGGIGELSPFDACPEVWITDDDWWVQANRSVESLFAESTGEHWCCSQCHEENAPSFEICWQCGHEHEN